MAVSNRPVSAVVFSALANHLLVGHVRPDRDYNNSLDRTEYDHREYKGNCLSGTPDLSLSALILQPF